MKVVVPVTIDDSNMTSDAVDETYPEWGTDYAVSEYPEPVPYIMIDLFMNWRTKDLWLIGGNRLFKQSGASGAFTEILLSANPFHAVTVNPYTGWVYTIHKETPAPATYEAVITKIDPATHEASELGRFAVAADPGNLGITCDGFTGDLFAIGGAAVVKYTYATDTLATHATLAYTYSRSIAVDPITKNLYVVVTTPTSDVLMQTAASGAFAAQTGAWTTPRTVAIDELTQDVYVTDTSPVDVYKRTAGAGAFAVLPDMGFSAVSACAALGDILFSDFSTAKLWAYSSKLFSAEDYAIYGNDVYYALADSYQVTPGTDSTKWFRYSAVNHLNMFDGASSTPTTGVGELNLTIDNSNMTAMGFFGVVAESITVTLTVDAVEVFSETKTLRNTGISDWYDYFFEPINQIRTVVFTDIPAYTAGVFSVTISGSGETDPVECALCVAGFSYDIGRTKRNVRPRIVSYSTQTIDSFGRVTFVRRNSAKRIEGDAFVEDRSDFERVFSLMDQIRDTPCMWIVSRDFDAWSILYGLHQKFEPVVTNNNGTYSFELLEVFG